jgi:hypothetical protein
MARVTSITLMVLSALRIISALGSAEIRLFEGHVVSCAQQAYCRRGDLATARNFPDVNLWIHPTRAIA